MPRPLVSEEPMTGAEPPTGAPGSNGGTIPLPRPSELQAEYVGWLEALPDNQQGGALAEALRAIGELDLSELQAVEPPRGFGRD